MNKTQTTVWLQSAKKIPNFVIFVTFSNTKIILILIYLLFKVSSSFALLVKTIQIAK